MKKSYTGLVIWSVFMIVGFSVLSFLPVGKPLLIRLLFNFCDIALIALTVIIYLNGAVYWFNGISYYAAVHAGAERRKIFAFKYLLRFGIFAVFYLIFSFISYFLGLNFYIDIAVFTVGILIMAISTITVRL